MNFTERTRKYILLSLIAFIVLGLIVANVLADKQNDQFLTNETLFNQAIQLQSTEDMEGAQSAIDEVLKKQPNSEAANYFAGLIAYRLGNVQQAANYMQKTLDINPHKVEDPRFMIQLGEVFIGAERYEDAKIVLLKCQESQWTLEDMPDYQETVVTMLAHIENLQLRGETENE